MGDNLVSEEKGNVAEKEIMREERLPSINTMDNYYHKIVYCYKTAGMGLNGFWRHLCLT